MLTLDQLRSNRNVLFWTLHAAGWAAYAISQYFGALLYEKPLELSAGHRASRRWRLRAVDADALHLSRLWGQAAADDHPRRADHLLRDRARAAHGDQHFLPAARRAGVAVQDAVRVRAGRVCRRRICCCAGARSTSASSTTSRCRSSARRRCAPRRWPRKRSSRCCATSSIRTSCSTR